MKLRQPFIAWIIILLLGLQLSIPSRVFTILLITFGGVFVSAYAWAWTLSKNIHLRRETRLGWVQVGGQMEERITLSNSSVLPAYIQFIDHSTLPGFHANRVVNISAGYFEIWNVHAFCARRGLFHLGDALLKTGDPFGMFDVTLNAAQRTSVLVLPQPAVLPEIIISPSGSFGEGNPKRNAPQKTIHAATVREYEYGDSTRLIHWPTTARLNKPFVRLMESMPEGSWWILLDLDQNTMLGEGWDSIEEQGVTLAVSLMERGLRLRKSVGLICNGEELAWHSPQRDGGQRWEILQSLAVARPGPLTLAALLEKMRPSLGKHHSLIIISASPQTDWLGSLPALANRGIIPTVLFLDPQSFGSDQSIRASHAMLTQRGVQCHILPHGLLEQPVVDQVTSGQWSWRTTSTGEVVPLRS